MLVTGHSLGGALATLSAYVLQSDLKLPVGRVFTYGSPRVGNDAFSKARIAAGNEWRITHHRDPVPHLPPRHLFGFTHTAREVRVFYSAPASPATLPVERPRAHVACAPR